MNRPTRATARVAPTNHMSRFNPDIHHRRSIRLKGFDYSRAGAYFVTICTWDRGCLFGDILGGKMRLNECGGVVQACLDDLQNHYQYVELDTFAIMPNHVHGVIIIMDDVGAGSPRPGLPTNKNQSGRGTLPLRKHTLGQIMGYFKYQSPKRINESRAQSGCPVWQRNFYEHVIRNEDELNGIRQYVIDNPLKWELDEENPTNVKRPTKGNL